MNEDKQSIMIGIVSDYKKGNLNMIDAANKISELSKLDINIVKSFLSNMRRDNIKVFNKKE